jgi:hypothetical protein
MKMDRFFVVIRLSKQKKLSEEGCQDLKLKNPLFFLSCLLDFLSSSLTSRAGIPAKSPNMETKKNELGQKGAKYG